MPSEMLLEILSRLDKLPYVSYYSNERRDQPRSTHPRTEARISALERRQTNLETHMEEVSEDITTSIKGLSDTMTDNTNQIVEYEIRVEGEMNTRFNQIDNRLN